MNILMNTNKMMRILFLMLLSMSIFIAPVQRVLAQQTYPVQIQPAVSFPSTLLNDYGDPANTSIRVYLADLTKFDYTINIRIQLTSSNISYKSVRGINIKMDGGQVYFLNANELAQLFSLSDLTVTASTDNKEPNSLPEGPYNLAVQAFDVSLFPTLVPISNILSDFTIFNVVRYDPPLLNSPADKQQFDLQITNQNIFFNWTPRHIVYSPNQHIQYRYRMIRVLPVDRNPYDAVNTSVAGATGNIDVNALDFATFIYSPTDLELKAGGVYAWQVQAYEMVNGIVSTSRFKNQGFSEVFTFSIKENCGQITLAPPVVSSTSVTFNWNSDPNSEYSEYEFNYRAVGSSTGWVPISTQQTTITLDNTVLQTGIPYEYNVRARCNNWLIPVQGSTFTLATPTCVAPSPLTVNTSGTATVLSWTAAQSVDNLKLYYKITGSTDPYSTVILNPGDVQYTLPLLTSGGYTIHLNALCGTTETEGATNSFAYNENGIVGPCPIPLPFQLIASRINGKVDMANLNWNTVTGAHTGSSITYWHKDSSTITYTVNASIANAGAGVSGSHIYDDQLYNYQITYLCGTKSETTPIGMFRILSAAAKVNIDPPTANCFPPVDIRAEARDSVTARVEWDKVSGAENYELSYRVKGTTAPFTTFNTTATNATLKPLQENAQYQLLVRVKCGGVFSIYSDTALVDLSVARNRSCDTIRYFKAVKKTTNNIMVAWDYDTTNTGYIIKYREESQPLASEYTQAFTNLDSLKSNNLILPDTFKYTFQNLKSGTAYIFRIQKICGQNNALFNLPLAAATLPDAKSSGGCGGGNVCNKDSTKRLTSLEVGDTIYCADYIVLVDSVTTAKSNPSMGIYSGLGHMDMPVPGLGDFVSMHVSFKNVKINAKPNSCVFSGTINIDSMNASIIPTKIRDSVKALMAKAEGLIDEANAALAQAQGLIDQLQAGLQQGIDYFQGGDGVGNVKTGQLGDQAINTDISSSSSASVNGNTVSINGESVTVSALPALIKDTEGEVYQVTSTGALTYVGKYDAAFAKDTTLDLSEQVVKYTEYTGATYDFDAYDSKYSVSIQLSSEYENINSNYYVPAKFIIPGALDKVTATLSGSGAEASKVVFSNGKGFVYDKGTPSGNTFTLNLAGGPASDGQYIYAWYVEGTTKKAIGKLLLPSYAPKDKNVVIIPVKGTRTYDPLIYEAYLNQTYQKIGITYHVTVDNRFKDNTSWAPTGDLTVQSSRSGVLSNDYQGKEKAIVEAYVAFKTGLGETIDPETGYFMAVYEATAIEDNLVGKMPAEEQFGFLYAGVASDDMLKRTMAHELGHGAYHMEHTFNTIYLGPTSKGNTANLMDYAAGNELWKLQWDIIHDPGHVWGILNRDRDAQALIVDNIAGAVIGVVVDLSIQTLTQLVTGDGQVSLSKYSWWSVAVSAGTGCLSSGISSSARFAKFVASPTGALVGKKALTMAADFIIDVAADIALDYAENNQVDPLGSLVIGAFGTGAGEALSAGAREFKKLFDNPAFKEWLAPIKDRLMKKYNVGAPKVIDEVADKIVEQSAEVTLRKTRAETVNSFIKSSNESFKEKIADQLDLVAETWKDNFDKHFTEDFGKFLSDKDFAEAFIDGENFYGLSRVLGGTEYNNALKSGVKSFTNFVKKQGLVYVVEEVNKGLNLTKVKSFVKALNSSADISLITKLRAFTSDNFTAFNNLLTSNTFGFDEAKFAATLKKAYVVPVSVNDLDEAVSLIGTRLTSKDLIDKLALLEAKNIPSFSKVAQELCCEQWNKYIGAEKVLSVVTDPTNNFLNKPGLEFEKYFGNRYYDIIYELSPGVIKYIEVKSWKEFNASTFKTQFAKDLSNIESFDQLEWIFDAKKTFVLKTEVINAMTSDKETFKGFISREQVGKLLGVDPQTLDLDNYLDDLITKLNEDAVFNSIFKTQ